MHTAMNEYQRLGGILAAFLLLLPALLSGQASLSTGLRLLLSDLDAARKSGNERQMAQVAALHDLQRSDGQWYLGAVADIGPDELDERSLTGLGGRINSRMDGRVTLRIPVERVPELALLPGIRYLGAGTTVSPYLQHSRVDTRADSVNAGLGGLPMGYTGQGVVIAIIDWGFDYTHPVFMDSSSSALRISRAWDQNKESGPAPAGYGFGTEYMGMDALLAAGADTTYVFGPLSHGTHVAGIAGGNGAGTAHRGMAPDAELVFISLRRTDDAFIDAIHYVRDHAQAVGKPFVVNMSFGGHLGPHDGSMPREQAMDQMAGPGRVFVGSAGNNGTGAFHLKWNSSGPGDTLRTVVNFGSATDHWGQAVPVWGTPGSPFALRVRLVDGANNTVHATLFHQTADAPLVNDTTVLAPGDTLFMRLAGEAASPYNGRPNMLLELRRTVNWKVVLELTGAPGSIHLWNVIRLINRTTNWGANFGSNHPGAVAGDNEYGLGEPAGVGASVITAASHRAEQPGAGGSTLYGALSGYSSRGPTVDGRTKPDISAPGQSVRSSVSSFDPATTAAPEFVEFNGISYPFDTYSGTSMSAPAVTGVVALMLQANPWLGAAEVKTILRGTARLDANTGAIGPEGSLNWGWGKVNALAAVLAANAFVHTNDIQLAPDHVQLYPNPATEVLNITGADAGTVRVFDMQGRLVLEKDHLEAAGSDTQQLVVGQLAPGTYLLEIQSDQRTVLHRFVRR